ncbi:Dyp-type peroxidase [Plantibacter sp. VKM Ac-2880]|uniref:Dyp-type peroxidase n=1 Tax=Plantibacter sp. VKM Ac-2880 TaxID=2783827 RepID=UPI00188F7895|nr:Dyp-type peroxidase [Plantibacter sp. VKM Ac-2880]MBF4567162.1 Dyp-type peroxidase [Plantibacter sp. VKM Ac-2880]
MTSSSRRVPIEPQAVDAPLSGTAVFLVLTVSDAVGAVDTVRSTLASVADVLKNVAFRDLDAALSCTVGIGARVWGELTRGPLPSELHVFPTVVGDRHTAPSTPGDVLLHIRAARRDLCFEFERQLLDLFGDAVEVVDETVGFRSFDVRDLLGFVDGTANPVGQDLPDATLVGDEDPAFAGGSYVVVQKYTHPLDRWRALTTEQQEAIIGRTKAENIELDDAESGQKSHKTLSTIVVDGTEHDILRDNMPFGSPAHGEFGTYFIGYARRLWVIERMLQRMFIGDPPGLHDRLLDFSTAETGSVFFAPSAAFLEAMGDDPDPAAPDAPTTVPTTATTPATPTAPADGSLGLGSLRPADERTTS